MKRQFRDFTIAAVVILILLGITGKIEEQDRLATEAHKRETIAAAKREFARRKREEWAELEAKAAPFTCPVAPCTLFAAQPRK